MEEKMSDLMAQWLISQRFSEIAASDEQYRTAFENEKEAYDRFERTLTDEQLEVYNSYAEAKAETEINTTRISYRQGMKDLLSLLRDLWKEENNVEIPD